MKKPRIKTFTILLVLFVSALAAFNFFTENYIGLTLDLCIIIFTILFQCRDYRMRKRLYDYEQAINEFERILTRPVFSENGNSVIMTFLSPTKSLNDKIQSEKI